MNSTSTARVTCDRPARYAKQLASHFSAKLETRWDQEDGRGHLTFAGDFPGEVDMIAGDGVLLLQLETDEAHVEKLEGVVGRHLVRFGAKDELVVEWKRQGAGDGTVWRSEDDVE